MGIEEYWQSRWWEKPIWRSQLKLSDEEINVAIKVLQQEFGQSWFNSISCPAGHTVSRNLMLGEGTPNIESLLDTAKQIIALRSTHGFERVLQSFKKEHLWPSASIEMLMGYVFKDEDSPIEFIIPKSKKGPTPDVLVQSPSGDFTIECKRLDEAKGEQWIERFQMEYFLAFRDAELSGLHPYVLPHNPYIPLRDIGFPNNPPNPKEYARLVATPVINRLKELEARGQVDSILYTDTHDLALFTEQHLEAAAISVPGPNAKFLMRRLMSNIPKAAAQIRAYAEKHGTLGIIVAWQADTCDYGYLNSYLSKLMATTEYKNVLGIMVMRMGNILSYQHPLWVPSPAAENTPLLDYIESILKKRLAPRSSNH